MLAGRRLVYVSEVRQAGGQFGSCSGRSWPATGRAVCRRWSCRALLPGSCPMPSGCIWNCRRALIQRNLAAADPAGSLCCLHPLVLFDAETHEVLLLNARRKSRKTEYLCYTSGQQVGGAIWEAEQRTLLAHVLGMEVSESQAADWATASLAEEPESGEAAASPADARRI